MLLHESKKVLWSLKQGLNYESTIYYTICIILLLSF
jgi:hypothetical protein